MKKILKGITSIRYHKKQAAVIFVFFLLLVIVYTGFRHNGVTNIKALFTNQVALENTYYIIQITIGIIMSLGAIIAVWQYVLNARAERAKIANDQIQKAIDLSEYYKDNILIKFTALKYIFEQSDVKSIFVSIDCARMKTFNSVELKEVLSDRQCKKIKELLSLEKTAQIIVDAERIYNTDFNIWQHIEYGDEGEGESEKLIIDPDIQMSIMSQFINSLLNNMEYFAMNFTHGTADDTVVYRSLHQTYLQAVELLYYNIAKNNIPGGAEYFTNVVELYKKWHNKTKAKNEKLEKITEDLKGSTVDNLGKSH
ncbi:hypothetical protein D3Z38_19065 [Clostridiales bacterium]|nr:hypothetical protein [Clostridiales bacterium]